MTVNCRNVSGPIADLQPCNMARLRLHAIDTAVRNLVADHTLTLFVNGTFTRRACTAGIAGERDSSHSQAKKDSGLLHLTVFCHPHTQRICFCSAHSPRRAILQSMILLFASALGTVSREGRDCSTCSPSPMRSSEAPWLHILFPGNQYVIINICLTTRLDVAR